MIKLKEKHIVPISLLLFLLIYARVAVASPFIGNIPEIPLFIQIFLLVNVFQHCLNYVIIYEVNKNDPSNIWNSIGVASLFAMIYALSVAILLIRSFDFSILPIIRYLIPLFFTLASVAAFLAICLLIQPIIRDKISNIIKRSFLRTIISSAIIFYGFIKLIPYIKYPTFVEIKMIYLIGILYILLVSYFGFVLISISEGYKKIGFVRKPFLVAFMGTFSMIIAFALIIYLSKNIFLEMYYNIISTFIPAAFAFIYYFRFVINYPSLLEPKWKALMPFDLTKVAAAITLAFLATSLFFTVRDAGNLPLYKDIPYALLGLVMVAFLAVMTILTYIKTISSKTRLRYWTYLKSGLFIHLIASLYVFSMVYVLWGDVSAGNRALFALFGLSIIAFYAFYALDLRKILQDLDIKPEFKSLDLSRYIVSLFSLFFMILFAISFTYGSSIQFLGGVNLESYPAILFFIVFFLVVYATYLSVTHKGFEEIMKKNVWSELSYLSGLVTFVIVYFIYVTLTQVARFPLRDMFFIGYFTVLLIEIYSTKILGIGYIEKYKMPEKKDVGDILNYSARHFLRTDYLERMWGKVLDRYATLENRLEAARFDAPSRTFYLDDLDDRTRTIASVEMLFEMQATAREINKITPITSYSYDDLKKDLEEVLGTNILTLPEELRSEFKEEKYYPKLYEKTVNNLIEDIQTFVPATEHEKVFKKLARVNAFFKGIKFEDSRIKVAKDAEFSREELIDYFKLYLSSLEEIFPFEHKMLYKPIKKEINDELASYGFSIGDLIDIVPTGFKKIDEVSDGGLHRRTLTLLITEETKIKDEVLSSFIKQGIRENDDIIYATSKQPAQKVCDYILMDFGSIKNITIIDLYQSMHTSNPVTTIIEDECKLIVPVSTTLFQRGIVKATKKYPKAAHKRAVLDVYNDLRKYYGEEEIFEILYKQIVGFKKWNCTCIITLDPTLVPKDELEDVKEKFDNVFILIGKDREASMVVEKLHGGTPVKKVISLR